MDIKSTLILLSLLLAGCASFDPAEVEPVAPPVVYTPAECPEPPPSLVTVPAIPDSEDVNEVSGEQSDRVVELEGQVTQLQQKLKQSDSELEAIESHLREEHSRADAVSALAEARVKLQRAARDAPLRSKEVDAANDRLYVAERRIETEDYGAAAFFIYRASGTADSILSEVELARASENAMFIAADDVNLRANPSTEAEVLGQLTRGTVIFPTRAIEEWIQVRTESGLGLGARQLDR